MRRQSYPELESSHVAESVDTAAVPHSASCLHPLHPARRLNAPYIVRINIVDRAFCEIPQSCDTGVRMEARCYWLAHIMINDPDNQEIRRVSVFRRSRQMGSSAPRPGRGFAHECGEQSQAPPALHY